MKVSIMELTLYKTLFPLREPKAGEEPHYQSTCQLSFCFFSGYKGRQALSIVKAIVIIIFGGKIDFLCSPLLSNSCCINVVLTKKFFSNQ